MVCRHSPRALLLPETEGLHCCWARQDIRNEEISLSDGALNEQGIGGGALSRELWGPTTSSEQPEVAQGRGKRALM